MKHSWNNIAAKTLLASAPLALAWNLGATEISANQAQSIVDQIAEKVEQHYVLPEQRERIASQLLGAADREEIASKSARDLANWLTAQLRESSRDAHMSVAHNPRQFEYLVNAQTPLKDASSQSDDAYWQEQAAANNWGVETLKWLPGKVGYFNLTGFWDVQGGWEKMSAAMVFLDQADALIIDLRENDGGGAPMVKFLTSHFLEDERLLISFYNGMTGETTQSHSTPDVPGPKQVGKPLYVLTGPGSASAAEEFASHVRHFEFGTLVGQSTAGAAHNNEYLPIADGFVLSLSVGRPIHPITQSNWEGEGVQPHVETDAQAALSRAHTLALENLAAQAAPEEQGDYLWVLDELKTRENPVSLSEAELRKFSGVYGPREIFFEAGELKYRIGPRPPRTLTPMGENTFAVENTEDFRLRFVLKKGESVAVEGLRPDGVQDVHEKR